MPARFPASSQNVLRRDETGHQRIQCKLPGCWEQSPRVSCVLRTTSGSRGKLQRMIVLGLLVGRVVRHSAFLRSLGGLECAGQEVLMAVHLNQALSSTCWVNTAADRMMKVLSPDS